MDFFSHALLPYLLGRFLRIRRDYLAALVLGGIAPDLDVLVVWLLWVRAGSKSPESSGPPAPPEDPPAPPARSAVLPKPADPLVSASLDLTPPVR